MGASERLQMLFAQDKAILQINTRLRSVPPPTEPTSEEKASSPLVEASVNAIANLKISFEDKTNNTTSAVVQIPDEPPSPHDGSFCPLVALSKFPYQHIHGDLMQKVASGFFDKGQFWERLWDLYYIHAPPRLGGRPIVLVTSAQARKFFREINKSLNCNLVLFPDEEKGLMLRFNREDFPQPTFLGQSTSRTAKDQLEATIPQASTLRVKADTLYEQLIAFEKMMEAAISAAKGKFKSKSKAKKQRLRVQRDIDARETVSRAQCYLGLRQESSDFIECKWDEVAAPESPRLTVDSPVPYPFWQEPVFISVDVEVNERFHRQVTEIGISTLDTRDLVGVAPGPRGENWQSRIRSHHLRVLEYKHHVNQLYVRGCPDRFEFGTSEWISSNDISRSVQACFAQPSFFDGQKLRHLVLVGHSLDSDIEYLRLSGVHIIEDSTGASKFAGHIDTATCFQMIHGETEPRSLGAVVGELGMIGWNLHNAGNDARYTMQVLVAMMVMHSVGSPELQKNTDAAHHVCVDLGD
ncbi:hypothetical protein BDV19DRAFT_389188 [Aspergillus venezuelensis]